MCIRNITSISCRENVYTLSNLIKNIREFKTVHFEKKEKIFKKVTWSVFKGA